MSDTPRVYLDAEYHYRSGENLSGCAVFCVIGIVLSIIAANSEKRSTQIGLGMLALVFLSFAGYGLWTFVQRCIDSIQITDEGLVQNGRLLPWKRIHKVEGLIVGRSVTVYFWKGNRRFQTPTMVATTPGLTPDQYEALARVLMSHIEPLHPHVKIGPMAYHDNSG